jgi:hypothetical protein
LAKGCYPGQEAVARMWMLGRPRRRLAMLRLTGEGQVPDVPLTVGLQVGVAPDVVELTAVDAVNGRALGFVPGRTEVGTRFGSDGVELEVIALPGDDPVHPGHDPAMRRRRDRAAGEPTPPRRIPG